ncbi:MAG: hypothetical protein A2020_10630 [Lentisphaerae bacterium GWF2_45_14]|nr:MAG: hypothetical protein A2020_10630 [Lentisphaerae bacterium GWF2_45_14]
MSDIPKNISEPKRACGRIFFKFSFNELLIVLFILALFSAMAIPMLKKIRSGMKRAVCTDSIMKINRLCLRYSEENGYFPPISSDRNSMWFGMRYNNNPQYDWADAPIAQSLSYKNRFVAICPEMYQLLSGSGRENSNYGFGFGYNKSVGSLQMLPFEKMDENADKRGIEISRISNPKSLMLFADTATRLDSEGGREPQGEWAMYPFAESSSYYREGRSVWGSNTPSVHFRHSGKANVSWVDGHVSLEKLGKSRGDWGKSCIGYLGPVDDRYFKPF